MILVSTLIFSLFALLTTQAQSIEQLYVLRFLTGIGVGGLMPNSIALTAEYAPRRIRATVIGVMFLGFPLGADGGGFIGSALIPALGWQSLFVLESRGFRPPSEKNQPLFASMFPFFGARLGAPNVPIILPTAAMPLES